VRRSVARLTLAKLIPSTFAAAFSTCAAHDAQFIPSIANDLSVIVITLRNYNNKQAGKLNQDEGLFITSFRLEFNSMILALCLFYHGIDRISFFPQRDTMLGNMYDVN
jgi:hypothetical protein